MITLTAPHEVKSVLGGTATIAYNKMILSPITYDLLRQTMNAQVYMTSTTSPDMQPIVGELTVTIPNSRLEMQVKQMEFYRGLTLSSGQTTALLGYMNNTQNQLESGLITLGLVAGTQSTGA